MGSENEERKVWISMDLVRIRHGIGTDSVRNQYGIIMELLLYNLNNMVKGSPWPLKVVAGTPMGVGRSNVSDTRVTYLL